MTKIRIIKAEFAGWKIKNGNTTAQQLPTIEKAKERAITLALSLGEKEIEIYDDFEDLIETISVEK